MKYKPLPDADDPQIMVGTGIDDQGRRAVIMQVGYNRVLVDVEYAEHFIESMETAITYAVHGIPQGVVGVDLEATPDEVELAIAANKKRLVQ